MMHRLVEIGSALQLPRNLREHVPRPYNIVGLLGRRITREEDVDVHFAEQIFGFFDMQPGGIFLDKGDERVTGLSQLPILSQLRRCLKLGKTDVWRRCRRNLSTLFLFHCDFFFDEKVVTKPGGTAEDDQGQEQSEKPLHGCQSATVDPSGVHAPLGARQSRCEWEALMV